MCKKFLGSSIKWEQKIHPYSLLPMSWVFTVPPKQITLYTVTTHKSGIVADNLKVLIFMFAVYVYDNLNMHLRMCLVLYSVGCMQ